VKCSELEAKLAHVEPQEVLRISEASCEANLKISTTVEFTLEGSPSGTTLKPRAGHANEPIIAIESGNVSATLRALTLTGTSGASAILLKDPEAHPTITEDKFVSNGGVNFGGAISIEDTNAKTEKPTLITHDVFGAEGAGNSATYGGGAIYASTPLPLVISNNTFVGNTATGSSFGVGGALYIFNESFPEATAEVSVAGNLFGGSAPGAGNGASYSGGGAFIVPSAAESLKIEGNRFIDNAIVGFERAEAARTGAGLGLSDSYASGSPTVLQERNVFAGNVIEATDAPAHTEPAGGAGEWVFGLTVHSTADRFEGNRIAVDEAAATYPPEGAGLGVLGRSEIKQPGVFVGVDDLFSGNVAPAGGWGGAIYSGYPQTYCASSCPGSSVTLEDSTVVGNSVEAGAGSAGGALWGSAHDNLTIENSIVYGNTPGPQIVGFGGTTSFAFSDLCNEAGGTPIGGAGLICANPLLNAAGEESATSPTVDAGSNALVPPGLSSDLAGNKRITAGRCGDAPTVDMGAFELAAAEGCTTTTSTTATSHTTTGAASSSTTATSQTTSAGAPTPSAPSVGAARAAAGEVEVTLTCGKGPATAGGLICEGEGRLLTIEHLRGRQVAWLSRIHSGVRRRIRRHTAVVGSARYKLMAGQKLKLRIALNALGRRLLRRFHRLPVLALVSAKTATGGVTVLGRHFVLGRASSRRRGPRRAKR